MSDIWVVDDDKVFHFVVRKFIQALNLPMRISGFLSGAEFIKAIEQPEQYGKPDLVLLDLNMPEVDGWKVIDHLETRFNNNWTSPIVVVTSSIATSDLRRSSMLKLVSDYVPKPLTLTVFEGIVQKHLPPKAA